MAKKLTKEEKELYNKIADEHTAVFTGTDKTAGEFIDEVAADLKSTNSSVRRAAEKVAGEWTEGFILTLHDMVMLKNALPSIIVKVGNIFNDSRMEFGNSRTYTIDVLTGHSTFVEGEFNPSVITNPMQETHAVNFYNADGTLGTDSRKYRKVITIQKAQITQFFLGGKLNEFIGNVMAGLVRTYQLYKSHVISTVISTIAPAKVVTGTATNVFEALSTEFYPLLSQMEFPDTQFNISAASKVINSATKSELLIFCGPNLKPIISAGVASMLFNPQLFDISSMINDENLIPLGKKLIFGKETEAITVSTENYIGDDTIIVIRKDAIKHITMLSDSGSQNYQTNLTNQMTLHEWFMTTVLPYSQAFIYKNPNLLTLPTK